MSHRFTPAKQANLAKTEQLNLPDNLSAVAAGDALVIIDDGAGNKSFTIGPVAASVDALSSVNDVNISAPVFGQALKVHDGLARRSVTQGVGIFLDIKALATGVAGNAINIVFATGGGDTQTWDGAGDGALTVTRDDWSTVDASGLAGLINAIGGVGVNVSDSGGAFTSQPAGGLLEGGAADIYWINGEDLQGAGGGATNLNGLSDVSTAGESAGEVLTTNGAGVYTFSAVAGAGATVLGGLTDWTVDNRTLEANSAHGAVGVDLSATQGGGGTTVQAGQFLRAEHQDPTNDASALRFVPQFPENVPYIRADLAASSYPGGATGADLANAHQLAKGESLADFVLVDTAGATVHMRLPETQTAEGAAEMGRQFTIKNVGLTGVLSIYAQLTGDFLEGVAEAGAGESKHDLDPMQSITLVLSDASVGGPAKWFIR
jgi:hypothetical protein